MKGNCQLVVFSNKAYNAIIRESFDKDPVETGGILLGHILDNGVWIVMEVLPPGINSIFQYAYFEYDEAFVNYLAQSVANQYKRPLDLLGLWHRHPGSLDIFSTTDDSTNTTFARQNPAGVISGLVNIDPKFRLTMYHMDMPTHRLMGRPDYNVVDVEVGDDIIPEEYFELRYFGGEEADLHPMLSSRGRERQIHRAINENHLEIVDSSDVQHNVNSEDLDNQSIIDRRLPTCNEQQNASSRPINEIFHFLRASNKKWMYVLFAGAVLIIGAFTIKSYKENIEDISSWVTDRSGRDKSEKVPHGVSKLSTTNENSSGTGNKTVAATESEMQENPNGSFKLLETSGNVSIGDSFTLNIKKTGDPVLSFSSSDESIAVVNENGMVTGKSQGKAMITVCQNGTKFCEKYELTVK